MTWDAADWLDVWVRGWVASRRTPPAHAISGGWRVPVGIEGDRERSFLRATDELADAAAASVDPPSRVACLVELDALDRVRPPAGWRVWPPDWFMVGGPPTAVGPELADGFRAIVKDEDDRALVEIRRGADLAAAGQVAVADGVAVPDRIQTEEGYRRIGLGRAVMRMLATAAADRGASGSVISASADGRALYEALGWTAIARFPSFARAS